MGARRVNQGARLSGTRKELDLPMLTRNLTSFAALCLIATLTACGPQPRESVPEVANAPAFSPDEENPILARVNGSPIRRDDVLREALAQRGPGSGEADPIYGDEEFMRVLGELIDQRLLAQEARIRSLHRSEEARRRLAAAEERILGTVLIAEVLENATSEDTLRAIYEQQVRLLRLDEEVRARHILVDTEEAALAAKALLDAGEDFRELAIRISQDYATRLDGGDLGYFTREGVLPAFGAVAFATPEGAVSEPFRTQFGWHVLLVVDRRRQPPPSLRPRIGQYHGYEQLEDLLRELRSGETVQRYQPALVESETPENQGEETD